MKYLAEFLGTFLLVLFGTGAIILHEEFNVINHFGISLTFGLAVFCLILIFNKISVIHINPAVSISLFLEKKIDAKNTLFYLFFQLVGALSASLLLHFIFPRNLNLGNTLAHLSVSKVFWIEFLMSFMLMLVILLLGKFKINHIFSAILIGGIVFLEAFLGGPFTGASMNPARTFGPSIISKNTQDLWIYFAAPISGMILSLICVNFVFRKKKNHNE